MKKRLDVVGIGNAIVDVLAEVEEEFLLSRALEKGSMQLIDEKDACQLHDSVQVLRHVSGGSAANTIAGMAMLGDRVAFIGKVKRDGLGALFEEGLQCIGVECSASKTQSDLPTARSIILVTPDAQRTMCTYLGTSADLAPQDIDEEIIRDAKILYFEGYLWDRPQAKEAIRKAMDIARVSGSKVAFSLSDRFCVDRHREEFHQIIEGHADLVFANESEMGALYGPAAAKGSSKDLPGGKVFAVTLAQKGSRILQGPEVLEIAPFKVEDPLDSTGAGDMYAAGFLHGFIQGKSLEECGRIGSFLASEIIRHYGARFQDPVIEGIKKKIRSGSLGG